MGVIQRRPRFDADEFAAYDYVAERNPVAAIRILTELHKLYERLAAYPEMGVARIPDRPDARIFPYRDYVVLYRASDDGDGIELVRLYGPRADWEVDAARDNAD